MDKVNYGGAIIAEIANNIQLQIKII